MLKTIQSWQWLILTIAITILVSILVSAFLAFARQPASTPVMRGYYLAQEMGCFACHGPGGVQGAANFGALWGETPPFKAGGAIMSFIQSDQDIREWILYGLPRRLWKDDVKPEVKVYRASEFGKDWVHELGVGGIVKMPAYEGLFSDEELEDLLAFVKLMSESKKPISELELKGRDLASSLGCMGCHGPDGRGGISNPGSFKGYIPPWDGDDYAELVRNEDELRQWILEGKIDRLEKNPLATYFTHGQTIQMPAFENVLRDGDLEAIIAYINWLRDNPISDHSMSDLGPWISSTVPDFPDITERGKWLYERSGCVSCHGPAGIGGVANKNASGGYVPSLEDLAENMELFEPEEVDMVISILNRGISLDDKELEVPLEHFDSILGQYKSIRKLILTGARPGSKGQPPAMVMPAWRHRLYTDNSPPSQADINAIIAYLISLYEFEEEDSEEMIVAVED